MLVVIIFFFEHHPIDVNAMEALDEALAKKGGKVLAHRVQNQGKYCIFYRQCLTSSCLFFINIGIHEPYE